MNTRLLNRHWPLPALLAWAAGWGVYAALRNSMLPAAPALGLATTIAALLAWPVVGRWRRALVAGGFPLSALVLGVGTAVPAWSWLLPLALLLLLYPLPSWRDAPVFPTSRAALVGLDALLPLPPAARILDAGCGLGHGLQALRAVWPQARLDGLERSLPLALASRLRCPWAGVRRGDMWATSWSGYDLVYLFQRPETMERAWRKACADRGPGGWLASLEFEVPGVQAQAVLRRPGQRPVHLYRLQAHAGAGTAQSRPGRADNPHRPPRDRAAA